MWVGSLACPCGLSDHAPAVQAYNEEAFRHFLTIERKRSQRGHRSLLLLLVSLRKDSAASSHIPPAVAAKMFAGLTTCLREIDFVGWYRNERIAGAVLVQGGNPSDADVSQRIGERVTQALGAELSPSVASRLQVRVLHRVGA